MAIFPTEEDLHKTGRAKLLADLGSGGVEIEKTDEMGDRDLAYEIMKRRRGKYALFTIKTDPEKITGFDRIFKLNSNLLKYLFVRMDDREKHG
jgi:small subunit ribosomal protein S6